MTEASPQAQTRVLRRLFLTLMMRGRRQRSGKAKWRGPAQAFGVSLFAYAALGWIAYVLPQDSFVFAASLHSFTFAMIGIQLATSCGQLLFNAEEAEVLLHRPLAPRALLAAKLQTISLVTFALALALNICGLVRGAQMNWLFVPMHLLAVALEVLFAAGLIVLAYNLCLRWFGRERLDNLMTTVQVLGAIGIMLGAQVVPQVMRHVDFRAADLPQWAMALPPVWFAALSLAFFGAKGLWLPAAIGVAATVLVVWLGVFQLAGTYEQGMATLNETSTAPVKPGRHGRWSERLRRWPLFRWWLRDPVEAAAFRLTLANLARARGVKLRVYPMLAQTLVIPLVVLIGGMQGVRSMRGMEPFMIAFVGFYVAMIPVIVLEILRLSEDHEAAEIFRQAPNGHPSPLFHGTRKAIMTLLCLPSLLLVVAAGSWFLRDKTTLLLLVPGLLLLPVFSLLPTLLQVFVPFAQPIEEVGRGCKMSLFLLGFQFTSLAMAALAGWLWISGPFGWALLAEAVLALLMSLGLRRTIAMRGFPLSA